MKKELSVALLALLMVSLLAGGCPPHPQPEPAPPGPLPPPDEEWSRTFGGVWTDNGFSVQQTTDSGFIIAGGTMSFGAGLYDFWLVKTDEEGNKEWSQTFGGTEDDTARSVQQTKDGGFIIVGSTGSFGAGRRDVWLLKIDAERNKEWSRNFGGRHDDDGWSVQQTKDGGFIIAGQTQSLGGGISDVWLVKTDQDGNKEWSRRFGGRSLDLAFSIKQTRDGGFIIVGETLSFGAGSRDLWLIKTDEQGNKEWSRTFGGRRDDSGWSVQQTADGGFIMAGGTMSFGAGWRDVWLVKTDEHGNKQWSRTFGGRDFDGALCVKQTKKGGFVIAAGTGSFGTGESDAWLIKSDSQGNKEWSRTFGGINRDVARSVQQTADGGFIVAGYTASFGEGEGDFWLIKLAPEQ